MTAVKARTCASALTGSTYTMQTRHVCTLLSLAASLAAGANAAPSGDDPGTGFHHAFTAGKPSFNARLRWENAKQENLREANAVTLRTRLGFTTAPVAGLQAMVEGENIAVLNQRSDYNAAGTNPSGAGRTAIGDPPDTAFNQVWGSYTASEATLRAGRQRIVLDQARFIGDVGWRQNTQTFDAATLTAKPVKNLTAFYGYIDRVNRVFGDKAPQPDWDSESHAVNVAYSGLPYGTLSVYAYLLDFDQSAANSSDTIGASFAGSREVSPGFKLTYRVEAATQRDAGRNPVDYRADYYTAELGGAIAPFDFAVGHEVLGSDGGRKGFGTPLATLHAFNGWADVFTATPARGLRDSYASFGVALPGGMPAKVVYHRYESDAGSLDYGNEWNAQITRKFGKQWSALAKVAIYDGKTPFADLRRAWLQVEYNF